MVTLTKSKIKVEYPTLAIEEVEGENNHKIKPDIFKVQNKKRFSIICPLFFFDRFWLFLATYVSLAGLVGYVGCVLACIVRQLGMAAGVGRKMG